jgi:hypothetical protein|nr:MAG TPA: ATP-dependent DNA helicase [Caudoviricetes sp.]
MKKQIFKVGDRVFDIRLGWGEVTHVYASGLYTIKVNFDSTRNTIFFTEDGKYEHRDPISRLSFTEYNLVNGGFSQERPINYEEYLGKWGKFTDISNNNDFVIGRLSSFKVSNDETYFATENGDAYNTFEPLTEEQIKVLGLCD